MNGNLEINRVTVTLTWTKSIPNGSTNTRGTILSLVVMTLNRVPLLMVGGNQVPYGTYL